MNYKFPERLREIRTEKGLSQRQLSKELNGIISYRSISLWEANERIPNLQSVMLLAEFFGVDVDYLSGFED